MGDPCGVAAWHRDMSHRQHSRFGGKGAIVVIRHLRVMRVDVPRTQDATQVHSSVDS